MPKLNVMVLSDGRPGHFNKSRAVIRALRSQFEVSETWLNMELRISWARRMMAFILNATGKNFRCLWLLYLAYRIDSIKQMKQPDIIISTGGNTMFANVLLAREFACPNLFVGGLRSIQAKNFWRVIHHKMYEPAPPHLHWPVTLVDIDRRELIEEAADFRSRLGLKGGAYWAFLIGGDGGGFRYTSKDMDDISRCIQLAYEQHGVRWLISTSRRTGSVNANYLKSLLSPEWLVASYWTGDEGPNDYLAFLGLAERIVCTEDSHMMMTEAIAAGKPVLSVRPQQGEAVNQDFLSIYKADGWITRQTIQNVADNGFIWPEAGERRCDIDLHNLGAILANALTS